MTSWERKWDKEEEEHESIITKIWANKTLFFRDGKFTVAVQQLLSYLPSRTLPIRTSHCRRGHVSDSQIEGQDRKSWPNNGQRAHKLEHKNWLQIGSQRDGKPGEGAQNPVHFSLWALWWHLRDMDKSKVEFLKVLHLQEIKIIARDYSEWNNNTTLGSGDFWRAWS